MKTLLILFAFGISYSANAINFKYSNLRVFASEATSIKHYLSTYLSDQGSGKIGWTLGTKYSIPSFVSLDEKTGLLSGVAAYGTKGGYNLEVIATDKGTGDQASMTVHLIITYVEYFYVPDEFNLGNLFVGDFFQFKILDRVWVSAFAKSQGIAPEVTVLNKPDWLTDKLSGTPKFSDTGPFTVWLEVHDYEYPTDSFENYRQTVYHVQLKGTVKPPPQKPVWKADTVLYTAKLNEVFEKQISDEVTDPSHLPLTFTKVSGPSWLEVNPKGLIRGIPVEPNLGSNRLVISASNGVDEATVSLEIVVTR